MYKKEILRSLALVSQLGFTVITPVLLCTFLGTWIDKKFNTVLTLPLIIIGIAAGINAAYRLVKNYLLLLKKEEQNLEYASQKNAPDKQEEVHVPKIKSRIFKD